MFDNLDDNYSQIPVSIKPYLIKTGITISNAIQLFGLNINEVSLNMMKWIWKMLSPSITTDQGNKSYQWQKLLFHEMGKYVSQIK